MKFVVIRPIVFLALIVTLLCAQSRQSFGQARPSSKNYVASIDPLGLALQQPLNLQFELKAGQENSWAFRAHWWWGLEGSGGIGKWGGPGLGASYRFYIADSRAVTGLSIAPAVDMYFFNQSLGTGASGASAIELLIQGEIAYKWIFDQFSIEPIVRGGIGFGPKSNAPSEPTGGQASIGLYGGYAW